MDAILNFILLIMFFYFVGIFIAWGTLSLFRKLRKFVTPSHENTTDEVIKEADRFIADSERFMNGRNTIDIEKRVREEEFEHMVIDASKEGNIKVLNFLVEYYQERKKIKLK